MSTEEIVVARESLVESKELPIAREELAEAEEPAEDFGSSSG